MSDIDIDPDDLSDEMNYEATVGYGQPPKHTRWQKGFCPNPSGRPRKTKTRKHYLEQVAYRKLRGKDGHRHRSMTVMEAITLLVKSKAIAGNVAASRIFEKLHGLHLNAIEPGVVKGVAFFPKKLTNEEWEREYSYLANGDRRATLPSKASNEQGSTSDLTRESDIR